MKSGLILPLVGLLAWSAVAGGCAGAFKVPSPAKAYFLADPGQPDAAPGNGSSDAVLKAVLKVRQFRVATPFDGSAFVYKVGPDQYSKDYYCAFLMPTDTMLSAAACQWLRQTGLFTAVVDSASSAHARYTLEGRINGLYADFTDPKAPRAVVRAQFFLLSDEETGPRVVFAKSYSTEAPVTGSGPAGIVEGWNHACRTMFEDLTADMGRDAHLAGSAVMPAAKRP